MLFQDWGKCLTNYPNINANMTSQNTVQFAQLTWREKAHIIVEIVQYWRWGLWNILYAIFIYSNPVKSIQETSASMSVQDKSSSVSVDLFTSRRFASVKMESFLEIGVSVAFFLGYHACAELIILIITNN